MAKIMIIVLLAINSSQQLTIASTVIRDGSGFRLPSTDNEYVQLVARQLLSNQ